MRSWRIVLSGMLALVLLSVSLGATESQHEQFPEDFFDGYQAVLLGYLRKIPTVEPTLYLTRTDFTADGSYCGKADLSNYPGDVIIQGELGRVSFNSDVAINGHLRCGGGTPIWCYGHLDVAESILLGDMLYASKDLRAGGNIELFNGDLILQNGKLSCGASVILQSGELQAYGDSSIDTRQLHISGTLSSFGNVNCTQGLYVGGDRCSIDGELTTGAMINCHSSLRVKGSITTKSHIIADDIKTDADIRAAGKVCAIRGGITVGGDLVSELGISAATRIVAGNRIECPGPVYSGCWMLSGEDESELGIIRCKEISSGKLVQGRVILTPD